MAQISNTSMNLIQSISKSLSYEKKAVENVLSLLNHGATIPFIARYRKEATHSMDETDIEAIIREKNRIEDLEKRRDYILDYLSTNNVEVDKDVLANIKQADNMQTLEDLYLPYKPQRRTRATIAKEAGLEELAKAIKMGKCNDIEKYAKQFVRDSVVDSAMAIAGARDIIAEEYAVNSAVRADVRKRMLKSAVLSTSIVKGKENQGIKYKNYIDFNKPLTRVESHQYLAINRAASEGIIRINIIYNDNEICDHLKTRYIKRYVSGECRTQTEIAVEDSYRRLIKPSIENELLNEIKQQSDTKAISVFAENARQLLMSPPMGAKEVLAIDPGYRTGCKVVCLDASGELKYHTVIYPTPPRALVEESAAILKHLVEKYNIKAIAIGNGTAGRETEQFVRNIRFDRQDLSIHLVSEAGASVYSASEIARREFPKEDITVRGAVSIGRRLTDPLAELVKIDPKSIGVGQYQHDVNQKQLKESLERVVENCVNKVGVDLNTASVELLTYISGIGPSMASSIVKYRAENGNFKNRRQLLSVPRLGLKTYEQCAGFLKIINGEDVLDSTAVHPESYGIVKDMAKDLDIKISELINNENVINTIPIEKYVSDRVGLPTLTDIIEELKKPGRDPRDIKNEIIFSQNIQSIDDISIGMELFGVINNITSFGAFVDLGIKKSGLLHISELSDSFVSSPSQIVKIGQKVKVKVIDIDYKQQKISLSMKNR